MNDIRLLIVDSFMKSGEEEDFPYFKIKFILKNGKELEVYSGPNNKEEGRIAFQTLKNNLPENMPFGGNLAQ